MAAESPLSDFSFPWDVPETPPLSTDFQYDHRDDIDHPPEGANIYLALVRDSREVCSHCFSRIRSVSTYRDEARLHWRRSKRDHLRHREESVAVDDGSVGYDAYRTARRYDPRAGEYRPAEGTHEPRVACERVPRLCARLVWGGVRYRCPEAPRGYRVTIDVRALRTELGRLKRDVRDSPPDTEIFASAVRRAVPLAPRIVDERA